MTVIESLKEGYYSFEDKWYGLVDSISEKVPVFGTVVDSLEDKGVPSFPLAIIIVILLLFLLIVLLTSSNSSSLTLTVVGTDNQPVEGATVVVLSGDTPKGTLTTLSDGKVTFFLENGTYSVKVDKDGYNSSPQEITLNGNMEEDFTLSLQDTTISKAVYLRTASGALIPAGSGTVIYRCKGDTTENTATYANGSFTASVNRSCTEIEVLSLQNYNVVSGTASFSGNGAVTVEQQVIVTGTVNVNLAIEGSTILPPAGLKVSLVPSDGTTPINLYSSTTGLVQFTSVPIKSYYVLVTDNDGNFQTYQGNLLADTQAVTKDTLTTFNVQLKKVSSSAIFVTIKDQTSGQSVSGAEVKLTLSTNANDFQAQITGATGQLTFRVAEGATYNITVDHPDYIVATSTGVSAGQEKTILLTKADSTNNNSLMVKVTDSKKNPIDNARVILKKIDPAQPIVGEKTTGATGEAEFFNLEPATSYMATISKENFGSVNSQSVQIVPRTQTTLEITFDIGEGIVQLKVMDSEKKPLSGVTVRAINFFTSVSEGTTQITSTEGIASFTIRADKKVYFVVESTGYSKYFTTAFNPTASATTVKDIILLKPTANLTTSLVGIYSGSSEVTSTGTATAASTIAAGTYTVKAVLQVPKGIFSEAGLHLRTGKETANVTNLMEEDGLRLTRVDSSGRITQGDTYSPPNGYTNDTKNLTTGEAKWANSVWKNPQEGTYEVEADISVTETNPNAELALYYRGWAKGSSTLRDPTSTIAAQNDLYSAAKKRVLTFGASTACTTSFCKSYTLQTQSGSNTGKTVYVNSSTEATKGTQYLLTADFTNYSGRALSGSVLTIAGKGIDINAILVNGNESTEKTINLGTIGIDAPMQVKILFNATTSGTEGIKFTINSSTKTEFEDTVTLNVKANKKFTFDLVPKVIIPYITNTLFFEAKDGNDSLEGALIEIRSSGTLIANTTTGSDGLAKYELAAPEIGQTINFKVMKEGYDTLELDKEVDSAILTITPPTIEETLKIGEVTALDTSIILQNNTASSLKITDVQINGDMKTYLDAKFNETIANTVIDTGKDRNYSLSLKVNSAASRLNAPKDVTGTIVIETEVTGTTQTYLNEIPVSIHLSMPGFLDSAKCLTVTPNTLDFITSDASQSKTITLTNQCTAESTKIALKNLQAKLSEASKFGTITLSGAGFSSTALSDQYVKIADFLEKDAESVLTINFTPSTVVASGTQAFTISIIGKNITDDLTEEKTESTVKTNITMSNISKCIEIVQPAGGVLLDIAPWNLGYGRVMQSDLSSYAQNYGGFRQSSPYGYGSNTMSGMSMMGYGGAGYGTGYQNGFSGMGQSGMGQNTVGQNGGTQTVSYEQSSFTIKNSCATDVDIDLDPDARINVSEEKFTISKDSDTTVTVLPGYVLGKYKVVVNAKPANSVESKKKVSDVSVVVRRLGDTDTDCISTNVTKLSMNSVILKPQKYSVYNRCYDTGVQLNRSNLVTIECSAPQATAGYQQQPYFQMGLESQYYNSGYPLTGSTSSLYGYVGGGEMQQSGCPTNACSLIQGTSVWFRSLQQGASGTIEKVDFQVYPSTQYIPQAKLFNSQSGQYGPFQALGDMRNWLTQSDSRINVYGKLNVSYQNQYGVGQCQEFPIQLEDIWRWSEILDSAFNWGDPQAKPKDCQNSNALKIMDYWKARGTQGEIPEDRYTNGNDYLYIAEPAALKIGPAPNQSSGIYPSNDYSYYRNKDTTKNTDTAGEASKNCGLLDSIDILTKIPAEKLGGATIVISPTPNLGANASGSLMQNTRGHNLMVEINRSSMTAKCVHLTMPISGKVSRKVNFESQELTWILDVIYTKQGYTYQGTPDECVLAGNGTEPVKPVETQSKCGVDNNYITYGFDKIKETSLTSIANSIDCSQYFCNGEMLQAFALNKFFEIKNKVKEAKADGTISAQTTNAKLSTLYKEAMVYDMSICGTDKLKFAKKDTKELLAEDYKIKSTSLTPEKTKNIIDKTGTALGDMVAVLEVDAIGAKDYNSILLEVDKNDTFKEYFTKTLAMTEVNADKYYLSLKSYAELNRIVNGNTTCTTNGKNCIITNWCGQTSTDLNVDAFAWMSTHSKLVKGIYYTANMDKADIEKVYQANGKLNQIHKLALFSTGVLGNDLLLTAITDVKARPKADLFTTSANYNDLRLEFTGAIKESATVGQYSAEFDYDYSKSDADAKTMDVNLSTVRDIKGAVNATKNALLVGGFNENVIPQEGLLMNNTRGTIFEYKDGKLNFYKTIPVKLDAALNAGEVGITYGLGQQNSFTFPTQLINWYATNGMLQGTGRLNAVNKTYTMAVQKSQNPQSLKGMYYYPQNGALSIATGVAGGRIVGTALVLGNNASGQAEIKLQQQGATPLELRINPSEKDVVTMDKIRTAVVAGDACATQDSTIVWNEANLIR
ncbi:MAG: carboxypeptidase-like regulatory domain-containing protein [archaeon]|jgi:hypothetical protein